MAVKLQTISEFAEGQRLDNYLIKQLKGVPKSHIYRIIRKGEVRVNKGRKKAEYKLQIDDEVRIPPIRLSDSMPNQPSQELTDLLKAAVLYEDKGLLIINKPSGLAVHSGSGINVDVISSMRIIYNQPIELVHRLDRATSGVLLLAKKRSVLKNLHQQLMQNQVQKYYTALVQGIWSKKRHSIDAPLYQNLRKTVVAINGKSALSHFHPVKNFQNADFCASLVEILIETGRTHQIRAHAEYAKHPLAYDDKYGDKIFNKQVKAMGLKRLFLHAHQLIFTNPNSGDIQKISAPLPAELTQFLTKL